MFVKGLTLVGVAAGRLGRSGSRSSRRGRCRSLPVQTAVCAISVAPIGAQPATMTAVNRIKAISLGGLSFLWSAGFSGIITLTYQLNLTQISIRIRLSLAINVDDTSSGPSSRQLADLTIAVRIMIEPLALERPDQRGVHLHPHLVRAGLGVQRSQAPSSAAPRAARATHRR